MKVFARVTFVVLSAFALTGCGLWDSWFGTPTPAPTPTSSPYTYTPPVITSSPTVTASPTATVTATPATTAPPPVATSGCLVGSWRADHTSLTNYMTEAFAAASGTTGSRITVTSGSLNIIFGADGSLNQTIDKMVVQMAMAAGNLSMEINGTVKGNFRGNTGNSVSFYGIGETKNEVTNITFNGAPFTAAPINFDTQFLTNDTVMNYACAGNTLTVSWELKGKTLTLVLAKA